MAAFDGNKDSYYLDLILYKVKDELGSQKEEAPVSEALASSDFILSQK